MNVTNHMDRMENAATLPFVPILRDPFHADALPVHRVIHSVNASLNQRVTTMTPVPVTLSAPVENVSAHLPTLVLIASVSWLNSLSSFSLPSSLLPASREKIEGEKRRQPEQAKTSLRLLLLPLLLPYVCYASLSFAKLVAPSSLFSISLTHHGLSLSPLTVPSVVVWQIPSSPSFDFRAPSSQEKGWKRMEKRERENLTWRCTQRARATTCSIRVCTVFVLFFFFLLYQAPSARAFRVLLHVVCSVWANGVLPPFPPHLKMTRERRGKKKKQERDDDDD